MNNISPYIWTGIFKVLEILVVGLILGLFASRYQKRKEIELKIKANLLLKRLEALEKVSKANCKLHNTIAPSAEEQVLLFEYIDRLRLPFEEVDYRKLMSSQVEFDSYYEEVTQLLANERVYFDYDIERIVSEYINFLSEIKCFMDAFWDTTGGDLIKVNLGFRIFGVVLQGDFNRFYAKIDQTIAKQMRRVSLSYKDQYFKKNTKKAHYNLTLYLERYLEESSFRGKVSRKIYFGYLHKNYGNSHLLRFASELHVVLMFIYYYDKYSIEEFDKLPDEQKEKLANDYQTKFKLNLHV